MSNVITNFQRHVQKILSRKLPGFITKEDIPIFLSTKADTFGSYIPIASKATLSSSSFGLEDWIVNADLVVVGNFKHFWVFDKTTLIEQAAKEHLSLNFARLTLGLHIPPITCTSICLQEYKNGKLSHEPQRIIRAVNHIRQRAKSDGIDITLTDREHT